MKVITREDLHRRIQTVNNTYCFKCKKDYVVDSKTKKCPECGDKLKILGKAIILLASNGDYKSH